MEISLFQRAILEAQKIREESYDENDNEYKIDMHEAATVACDRFSIDPKMAYPIYLLNKYTWNDIQMWAENPK